MSVLVDTCVWSLALRRRRPDRSPEVEEFKTLIIDGRAKIMGPIRQEILSGIRSAEQYGTVRDRLRAFPDIALETADYELAAEMFTVCRRKGLQGSNTDFLICAVAEKRGLPIFTTDADFARFAAVLPIKLHSFG